MTQKTILNDTHRALGAKMVDFGGWDMPLNYGSQIEEHHQVRRDAGMFDVSHMTVVDLHGARVREFLRHLRRQLGRQAAEAGQGAVHVHAQRAGRRDRRPDRLFPGRGLLPPRRQRRHARQGPGLDQRSRRRRSTSRSRERAELGDDRGAGPERAREGARPAARRRRARAGRQARQVRRGRGEDRRRHAAVRRAHRLHRRGRLRDHRAGGRRRSRCGMRCSPPA